MIKLKSIIVILLSSLLISAVILLTILGLSVYAGWKEGESARRHRESVAALNAKHYDQLIKVDDLEPAFERDGPYKGRCTVSGLIKNAGYRTLRSVRLRLKFLNDTGSVIHKEYIFPLKASVPARVRSTARSHPWQDFLHSLPWKQ